MKKIILSLIVALSLFACEREIINDLETDQYASFPNFQLPEGKTLDIVLSDIDETVFELDLNMISRFPDAFYSMDVIVKFRPLEGKEMTKTLTNVKEMPVKVSFSYKDLQDLFGDAVDKNNLPGCTINVSGDNIKLESGTVLKRYTTYTVIEQQNKTDEDGNKVLDENGDPVMIDEEVVKTIDNYTNNVTGYVIFNPTIDYSILGAENMIESGDYSLVGSYYDTTNSSWVDTDPVDVKIVKDGRKMTISGKYIGDIGTLVVQAHFGVALAIEGELELYDLGPTFIYKSSTSGYNLYERLLGNSKYSMEQKYSGGTFIYTSSNNYFEQVKYIFTKK
ncbi:hypothetical protein OAT16_01440 [Prolixibacteraceae bacterium]|nr:hypothetical protein [Prolixibacteraceae bacterium]